MKSLHLQSTARILVLVIVAVTLLATQVSAWRNQAIEILLYEVCLALVFILSSLISWKRYF